MVAPSCSSFHVDIAAETSGACIQRGRSALICHSRPFPFWQHSFTSRSCMLNHFPSHDSLIRECDISLCATTIDPNAGTKTGSGRRGCTDSTPARRPSHPFTAIRSLCTSRVHPAADRRASPLYATPPVVSRRSAPVATLYTSQFVTLIAATGLPSPSLDEQDSRLPNRRSPLPRQHHRHPPGQRRRPWRIRCPRWPTRPLRRRKHPTPP